jgi:hypothetical protein
LAFAVSNKKDVGSPIDTMTWQFSPYTVILGFTAIISFAQVWHVWRQRISAGRQYFVLLMMSVGWWALAGALEMAVVEIPAKIFWSKISYIGIVALPVFWFYFALDFGRRIHWLSALHHKLLWLIPIVVFALTATNEWHGLIWPEIVPISPQPGAILLYGHGIAFWLNIIYIYTLLAAGTLLIVQSVLYTSSLYRYQAVTILLAVAIPWLANMLYVSGVNPLIGVDLTPLAFSLTGLLIAWALFRFRLLDLIPVAREAMIARMTDGVIVIDVSDRVIEINAAAAGTAQQLDRATAGEYTGDFASACRCAGSAVGNAD